jgi:hypothetical protein
MLQKLEKYISIIVYIYFRIKYIPEEGLEPSPFKRQEPKPCTSTNSVTLAINFVDRNNKKI